MKGAKPQPESARPTEAWASGDAYEPFMGRWSRPVAEAFLDWLAVPPESRWLEVGCGTGALSRAILQRAAPAHLHAIDRSAEFVTYAQQRITDRRASFAVGDALSLAEAGEGYDAAVSGLALNFIPQPERAVAEMLRCLRPGGVVACYVWDYADRMQMLRYFWDAVVALDPGAAGLYEGTRFPLCQPEPLRALFRGSGLQQVAVQAIEIATVFKDFDDYWRPFLGGQGPAPGYVLSLDQAGRERLRERLRADLPAAPDGSLPLAARAWAVRGVRGGLRNTTESTEVTEI